MPNLKTTAPKPFCFVLMPFSDEFHDVYNLGIKEACTKAGAYCERVDEQIFHERILDRVYNQISKADIVIADMTGRNPNVFYEVGYAHALNKLTILLTQNADDIPFDLKHFPHIVYGNKVATLRDQLKKRVKHFIDNPPEKPSESKLDLELFIGEQNLGLGNTIITFDPEVAPQVSITVSNVSSNTFAPGDFKIGIETSPRFSSTLNEDRKRDVHFKSTKLPNGNFLHMFPNFPLLFPDTYDSLEIYLVEENLMEAGDEEIIWVKLFTKQGSRNFPVSIQCIPKKYT